MPHIITNDKGETIDLNTAAGQYRYVANALVQYGVHSQILDALAALYRDGQRIDWLADKNNTVGQMLLPREIVVERNLTSMRDAIDVAMLNENMTFKVKRTPKRKTTLTKTAVDAVNHPPHYTTHPSGVECIQITEHMEFCLGNAVKYIWRADEKGRPVEDLKKARWYIDREIARRSNLQNTENERE